MLCVLFICVLCEKKNNCETRWGVLSLTERTEFTEHFGAQFRFHRRPLAYRGHRALLLKVAVRFCEIGWLNVSVGLCVFCSSVFFCERKKGPLWEKERSSVRERILTMQTGNVKIFHKLFPSTFENRPNLQQEHAFLRSRTCFSWPKKGMFNEHEGHVLKGCS